MTIAWASRPSSRITSFLPCFPRCCSFWRSRASFRSPTSSTILSGRCARLRRRMCSGSSKNSSGDFRTAGSGGILTVGILGALWSSSAAVVAIVGSLNRAYDIEEGRPWWKVRLTAIGLTVALALLVLSSFTLIVVGPTLAEHLASSVWVRCSSGRGRSCNGRSHSPWYPPPSASCTTSLRTRSRIGPGLLPAPSSAHCCGCSSHWRLRLYVANFADYNATYGAVGGVIVLLLWFYISGLAILVGAELNAEIEHASPARQGPGRESPRREEKDRRSGGACV